MTIDVRTAPTRPFSAAKTTLPLSPQPQVRWVSSDPPESAVGNAYYPSGAKRLLPKTHFVGLPSGFGERPSDVHSAPI
ncbi:MAG: hypothetical protein CM15mP49_35280 [Actinomycetota bacterium]|nr:MAG: hypothetical protein CM15mP49_35280 [Actinomycetota bacterium]